MEHKKVWAVNITWSYGYDTNSHFKLFDDAEKAKSYFEQLITEEVDYWNDLGYPVTEEMFKDSGCYRFNEDTALFERAEGFHEACLVIKRNKQSFEIYTTGDHEFAIIEISEKEIN